MKHFLSLSSSVAKLTKAVQCVLLLTLVPMYLLAGGGFVPVQIHVAPQSIVQQTGQPFQNPVLRNDVQLGNFVAEAGHPFQVHSQSLLNTLPPQQQNFDNLKLDNLSVEDFQTSLNPQASSNSFLLNDVAVLPTTPDPKVDIEINIRIDLKDIIRLNELDSDLPYRNPSATISQPVPQLENIGLEALAEPESAEIAGKTFAPNTDLLKLVAWPNPSFGQFQATFNGANQGMMTYRIVSLSGQIIQLRESESSTVSFDLSGYPAGSYWLQVLQGDVKLATQILLER